MKIISRKDALELGLKLYFTGVPCPYGHLAERRVNVRTCGECARDGKQRYLLKNKERLREYMKEYVANNREAARLRNKKYYAANREEIAERTKEKRAANPLPFKERQRRYYEAHKEECGRRNVEQRRANPDKFREYVHRRRARVSGAGGSYTADDLQQIKKLQRNKCARCQCHLSRVKVCVDHITPIVLGGSNQRSNIQLLCQSCNLQKWAHDPIDDARSLGKLL